MVSHPPVRMVDVSEKEVTVRRARARACVKMTAETMSIIENGKVPKGDVLAVARVAAIQAAKETSRILPLCHPIPLEAVEVRFQLHRDSGVIEIEADVQATWKTGVEMEALCAASAAALTIYDMCKALERGMSIETVELMEKTGGRSGKWVRS